MKVALIGYGKMGKELHRVLEERGHSVGLIIDVDNTCDLNSDNLKQIDVAIEFSSPETAFSNVATTIKAGTPIVCGTTAWLDKFSEAVELCNKHNGAFFYATNYSVGVNILFKVNQFLASLMNPYPQYDVTIEEVHHTAKKDSPSGTAITLAEGLLQNLDRKQKWVGNTTTEQGELEVLGIRRSIVPGTHTITWESAEDMLRLEHTAKGRAGLALGAVLAAEFLVGKKGVYSMDDLMKF